MTVASDQTALATAPCCSDCGTEIASGLLSCPGCHRLVHAQTLAALKAEAGLAASRQDAAAELAAWRSAAVLVPPDSRQHAAISARMAALAASAAAQTTAAPEVPKTGPWKWLGGLGTLGLVLWKFKFLLIGVLGKGKLLLLGLTKAGTFFSMFLSFGVYWTAWGMWFALGFVLSIYVHEMGHIAALRRFGHDATVPMFVPGLGAFIRLKGRHLAPYENARIGLAGPLWGLGAAGAAFAGSRLGGGPMWAAIASTGAWINLFNLMPVWQLDGSRGFAALSKPQRLLVAVSFLAAWAATSDGLLILLGIVALARAFEAGSPDTPDYGVFGLFVFLVITLSIVFHTARV
jgi:Zn-dependent protease